MADSIKIMMMIAIIIVAVMRLLIRKDSNTDIDKAMIILLCIGTILKYL